MLIIALVRLWNPIIRIVADFDAVKRQELQTKNAPAAFSAANNACAAPRTRNVVTGPFVTPNGPALAGQKKTNKIPGVPSTSMRQPMIRISPVSHLRVSPAAQSRSLRAAAGACGIGGERWSLRGDARGSARRFAEASSKSFIEMVGLRFGQLAWRCCATCSSRSPPSRAGLYARASARIRLAERGCERDLELGKAMERMRGNWWSRTPD
jgi:hypothetical protein